MRLITLNTGAGRIKKPFEAFLEKRAKDTDIFCFQDIYNNLSESESDQHSTAEKDTDAYVLKEITTVLSDFNAYFCPVIDNVYGIAIFLKKNIELVASGEVVLYENAAYTPDDKGDHTRKMQWVHIKQGRKDFMIMNVHGHYDAAAGTSDTPHRIEQSKKIVSFMEQVGMTPKLLVGDFNLHPQAESILMLEKHVVNLVTKHGITSTRTSLSEDVQHVDYVFISSEILTESFTVLPDVVSDHAPLCIDFDTL